MMKKEAGNGKYRKQNLKEKEEEFTELLFMTRPMKDLRIKRFHFMKSLY